MNHLEIKKHRSTFKQLSPSQAIGELVTSTNHYANIQLEKFILLSNQTDAT